MSKTRVISLGVIVVLSALALLTSSALAAISFEWRVGGKTLKENKTFEFNNDGKTGELKGTVGGTTTQVLFNLLTIHNGQVHFLLPSLSGTVLLLNIVVDRPAKCAIAGNAIKTVPLKAEIVEGAAEGKGSGEVDLVVAPESGSTIAEFEFTNSECVLKGLKPIIAGSFLALALPQKTEVVRQDLDFEAATKEYRTSGNQFKKAGLTFAGSAATLSGLTLMTLTSGEAFGPF